MGPNTPRLTAKAKSAAASAAKAAAAKERRTRKAAEAPTLIEKQDLLESLSTKRAKKEIPSNAAVVAKALRDNFKGWGEDMTDLTIREGKSLRQRIFDDKFESKEGGAKTPMGKCYYAELRGMYGASSCPAQQLDVKNEDEAEDPRLIGALTGLFQRKKTFDRILEWLASAEMVNQKNFVALLRACSSFSPASTMDHLRLALAVMEYCAKHSVLKRYPFEMGVMTPYFAAALVKSYLNFKKHDLTKTEWWKQHKSYCFFVLPVAHAEKCFQCKGGWAEAEESLAEVVRSGELGRYLFGRAWGELAANKISVIIKALVKSLLGKPITKAVLDKNKLDLVNKVKELGKDIGDTYTTPTTCQVRYMGVELCVPVISIFDEYQMQVWGIIKTVGVQSQKLEPIISELHLGTHDPALKDQEVHGSLLLECGLVRGAAERYFEPNTPISAALAKEVLDKHCAFLLSMDKRWKIEKCFFTHACGEGGAQKMRDAIVAALPNEKRVLPTATSLQELTKLGKSALFDWVGIALQAAFQSVLGNVQAIAGERAPNFDKVNDPFLLQCKGLMALWCDIEIPKLGVKPKRGADTAKAAFTHFSSQVSSGKKLSFKDTQTLVVFGWLLSEEDRKHAMKWLDLAAHCAMSGPPGEKPDEAPARQKRSAPSAKVQVSSLFKKVNKA